MLGRGVGRELAGDVFPALGVFIGGGAAVGAAVGIIVTALMARAGENLLLQLAFCGAAGAFLGLIAGLSRGVWPPAQPLQTPDPEPAREPEPSPQLWDPWLDNGRDPEWVSPEPAAVDDEPPRCAETLGGFPAARARVRPRVISPETGEVVLLEDEIGPLIQAGRCGLVEVLGGPGSGKTTVLRHLAACLPPWARARVLLLDEPEDDVLVTAVITTGDRLVISTGRRSSSFSRVANYHFASWGQDDLIEYLLSAHRDACPSVMARLKAVDERGFLEGIPELWVVVLDRMAGDESIGDVRTALWCELAARLDDSVLRERIEDFCLTAIGQNSDVVLDLPLSKLPGGKSAGVPFAVDLLRLLRHRPVALLLAADRIAAIAERDSVSMVRAHQFPRDLIQDAARLIEGNTRALQHLGDWVNQSERYLVHPIAASLLHAATPGWRPNPGCRPRLHGAYLDRVAWSGLDLEGMDLEFADFEKADLSEANLRRACVKRTRFHRADLHRALLTEWRAQGADLSEADLRSVRADRADFMQTNLSGARLIAANLWKADFRGADINGADFTGAVLEDARLMGLKLSLARFDGARFGGADLRRCDLEDMELMAPDFHGANLRGALLTDSRMPGANFVGADLRGTGLADVDWPGAYLCDANLRDACFHLGSSRSGLVGSPIACEGSRTGFYTDDYHDQDVKPAEEIRKANLRGADLRGARIEGVDFYLVDLRDAKYTRDQAEHFRHCRAIL
ncbi:MAG: pentapeptide repeat-containing protein [Isosphaerales bacterium]